MNLRGLEMLLTLLAGLLGIGLLSGQLGLEALLWAALGIFGLVSVTDGLMRFLLPFAKEELRWLELCHRLPELAVGGGGTLPPTVSGQLSNSDVIIGRCAGEQQLSIRPRTLGLQSPVQLELRALEPGEAPPLRLGDAAFDAQVYLRGARAETVAVLDADTRDLILEALRRWNLSITAQQLRRKGRRLERDLEDVHASIHAMQTLGERLFRLEPKDVPQKLKHNAAHDPQPEVRAHNLRVLLDDYVIDEEALDLSRGALDDPDLRCVLEGAAGLAEYGNAQDRARGLLALEELLMDQDQVDNLRAQALRALASHGPASRARALLARLCAKGALPSCAPQVAVQLGDPISPQRLIELNQRSARSVLIRQIAVLEALEGYEVVLLSLLDHSAAEVVLAALVALSQTGSVSSIPRLRRLQQSVLIKRKIRRAAQRTIAQIKARQDARKVGGLSLPAQSPIGELSVLEGRD